MPNYQPILIQLEHLDERTRETILLMLERAAECGIEALPTGKVMRFKLRDRAGRERRKDDETE